MNEEEKRAYNYIKNTTEEFLNNPFIEITKSQFNKYDFIKLKILLNLIERQQKEIEKIKELKNKKDFFVGTYGDLVELATAEGTFNYISKDKIKQKLSYEEDEEITEEQILSIIETMWEEFNRLEDLEDKMDTQYISKNKIKQEIKELDEMNVEGEVFITAVNFAKKILKELLEK